MISSAHDSWTAARGDSVRVVTTPEGVEELRRVWTNLQRHPNSDIDFYSLIVNLRPGIIGPCVIVVSHDGQARTVLVGRMETGTEWVRIGYQTILKIPVRRVAFITGGYMGEESSSVAKMLISEILKLLPQHKLDLAVLQNVRSDSLLLDIARTKPGWLQRDRLGETSLHWRMKVPACMADFYTQLRRNHRQHFKRLCRVLDRDFPGGIEIKTFQTEEEALQFSRDAEKIARLTYQRGLGAGFTDDMEHQKRLEFAARNGRFRGFILYVENEPKAFWGGSLYQTTLHLAWTGYAPSFRQYEVGTVLFLKMLEALGNSTVKELDFGLGSAFYKERFGDSSWQEESIYIYSTTARGIILNVSRAAVGFTVRITKAVLHRMKLTDRIKRRWRAALTPHRVEAGKPAASNE